MVGDAEADEEESQVATNLAKAAALKEEGNEAFKRGDYKAAMIAYHQIYMYVHGFSETSGGAGASSSPAGLPWSPRKSVTEAETAQLRSLKVAHFSNLAACHLKLGAVPKARDCCSKALALDPGHLKARFRRGKCLAALGALDDARDDLETVLRADPENREAHRELRELKMRLAAQRRREAKKFAGFFDRLSTESSVGSGPWVVR
ncbi:hypothetical protein EMIHUDRAFT_239918 [Emiliania huxleyi CCMP1516]|uniref:Uncharacterized protein n=2 Tax=Emiliania huxleyi TaxID=2903 RepID=A0A0D3JIE5_EMIH1|nr:hypothetical protein EMIHUDRAFT_239918 [Emiliania huxleyi CCMP1516]EOD23280.1 hypothetical protein EMIHUDRAFT_239918 [Emiliania huxleyi CCMP1516]|eukprot:XP_005775709.1 hypothetical protein EMIHUDRAFT_239918 [Emiliania huxleyi CCMP1516]